jgi:hypothetical protein
MLQPSNRRRRWRRQPSRPPHRRAVRRRRPYSDLKIKIGFSIGNRPPVAFLFFGPGREEVDHGTDDDQRQNLIIATKIN